MGPPYVYKPSSRVYSRMQTCMSKQKHVYAVIGLVSLLTFADRGIIPGASEEFNSFIRHSVHTAHPSALFGLLQSAYILGLCTASLVFGHLVHRHNPFSLITVGVGVWCVASVFAGASRATESYWFLLAARTLSGVGEASFNCAMPPFILDTAPHKERGKWMAAYFMLVPIGTALGFVFGAQTAAGPLGWQWAFYGQAMVMLPLVLLCSTAKPQPWWGAQWFQMATTGRHEEHQRTHHQQEEEGNGDVLSDDNGVQALGQPLLSSTRQPQSDQGRAGTAWVTEDGFGAAVAPAAVPGEGDLATAQADAVTAAGGREESDDDEGEDEDEGAYCPSWREELSVVLFSPTFVLAMLASAAVSAMTVGFTTFGPSLIRGLGLLHTEKGAAAAFGTIGVMAGLVGSPLGGSLMDCIGVSGVGTAEADPDVVLLTGGGGEGEGGGGTEGSYYDERRWRDDSINTSDVLPPQIRRAPTSARHRPTPSEGGGGGRGRGRGRVRKRVGSISGGEGEGGGGGGDVLQDQDEDGVYAFLQHQPAYSPSRYRQSSVRGVSAQYSQQMNCASQLRVVTAQAALLLLCGFLAALTAVVYTRRPPVAFFGLFFAEVFSFASTPPLYLALMASVPSSSRSFALAVNMVGMHALGDLPAPFLVGLFKDWLAPACSEEGTSPEAEEECVKERWGLRMTVLLLALWSLWAVLALGLASYYQHCRVRHLRRYVGLLGALEDDLVGEEEEGGGEEQGQGSSSSSNGYTYGQT